MPRVLSCQPVVAGDGRTLDINVFQNPGVLLHLEKVKISKNHYKICRLIILCHLPYSFSRIQAMLFFFLLFVCFYLLLYNVVIISPGCSIIFAYREKNKCSCSVWHKYRWWTTAEAGRSCIKRTRKLRKDTKNTYKTNRQCICRLSNNFFSV